ncbi:MAG: sulfotransferase family 2 domain-containing protein [Pseudomonadota bacterium]
MIISHKYQFIFLRTEKTAGTSLSHALAEFLGEDDVRADMSRPSWASFSPIHHGALKRNFPKYFGLHAHATAAQIRSVIGAGIFDSYYKFAVERNPWDRQVSLYFQRYPKRQRRHTPNFSRDLASPYFRSTEYVRLNNWANYAIDNSVVADDVILYHRLEEGLKNLKERLSLPKNIQLGKERSGFRDDKGDYRRHYTDKTHALIGRWYAREIKEFGFMF